MNTVLRSKIRSQLAPPPRVSASLRLCVKYQPLLILALTFCCAAAPADDFPTPHNAGAGSDGLPLDPQKAADSFQLPPGFKCNVFAAEPDVQNPVAMTWDNRGRLWVAECYTYANRPTRYDLTLRDRVIILHDTDGDGKADQRKVFCDNVQQLMSVEVGLGGVWLIALPRLLFIADKNGDDIPDGPPEVVLDGFETSTENYHNCANGLRWGLDGWLYGRCGASSPGWIGPPGSTKDQRTPIYGGIWRYHPTRKIFEVLCHGFTNPWGHDWDEHGEMFITNTVTGHLFHLIPGAHHTRSATITPNRYVYDTIDSHADHFHYSRGRDRSPLAPRAEESSPVGPRPDSSGARSPRREDSDTPSEPRPPRDYAVHDQLGGGHAHCGAMIYLGDNWPAEYRGKLFTLNLHGRRINVDWLERHGSGYVAHHSADMAQSADTWFRGIDLNYGPDGAVYILDWSDTGECHEHDGIHRTSGRVFRLSYELGPKVGKLGPRVHPGTALTGAPAERVVSRLGPGKLDDPDEHHRARSLRLATDLWPIDTVLGKPRATRSTVDPPLIPALILMANADSSGLVRLVLASILQRLPVENRPELAAALLSREKDAEDHNLPKLIWYGLIPVIQSDPAALVPLAANGKLPLTREWITRALAEDPSKYAKQLNDLLTTSLDKDESVRADIVRGLAAGLSGRRKADRPPAWEKFQVSLENAPDPVKDQVRSLAVIFGDGRALDEVRQIALDDRAKVPQRQAALESLIEARPDDLRDICQKLLRVRFLNTTAVKGLTLFDDPAIGEQLARSYNSFHPVERPAVIETLVSRPAFAAGLLDQIEAGRIPASDVSAAQARQIRTFGDEKLTARLAEVWGELRDSPQERRDLIAQLKTQLTTDRLAKADESQGRAVFQTTCANCHRLFGAGGAIAPDLTGSGRHNLDYLLENIVDPSAVVNKDFRMSVVRTTDGRVLNGLVIRQDDDRIVLQLATTQAGTAQLTLMKSEIDDLKLTSLSPMPEGMLQPLKPDQIRDLISYLQSPTQVNLPADFALTAPAESALAPR